MIPAIECLEKGRFILAVRAPTSANGDNQRLVREPWICIGYEPAVEIGEAEGKGLIRILQRCMVQRIVEGFEGHGMDGSDAMCGVGLDSSAVRRGFQLHGPVWLRPQHREARAGRREVAHCKNAVTPYAVKIARVAVDALDDRIDIGSSLPYAQLPGMLTLGTVVDGNIPDAGNVRRIRCGCR